ncbi:hypothetical protein BDV95DRAFT_668097 [Massariosphaeria phaeospora]|uniref:Uncharacterized protein n=1 Tax=Massariosphaeria phaeospora TaxID=100035 RepID=A0A7C8IAH8_9PLEO|nr:hypothetical protein BDV95DRAFT_668097 [Massariosphaeria phaeospora]
MMPPPPKLGVSGAAPKLPGPPPAKPPPPRAKVPPPANSTAGKPSLGSQTSQNTPIKPPIPQNTSTTAKALPLKTSTSAKENPVNASSPKLPKTVPSSSVAPIKQRTPFGAASSTVTNQSNPFQSHEPQDHLHQAAATALGSVADAIYGVTSQGPVTETKYNTIPGSQPVNDPSKTPNSTGPLVPPVKTSSAPDTGVKSSFDPKATTTSGASPNPYSADPSAGKYPFDPQVDAGAISKYEKIEEQIATMLSEGKISWISVCAYRMGKSQEAGKPTILISVTEVTQAMEPIKGKIRQIASPELDVEVDKEPIWLGMDPYQPSDTRGNRTSSNRLPSSSGRRREGPVIPPQPDAPVEPPLPPEPPVHNPPPPPSFSLPPDPNDYRTSLKINNPLELGEPGCDGTIGGFMLLDNDEYALTNGHCVLKGAGLDPSNFGPIKSANYPPQLSPKVTIPDLRDVQSSLRNPKFDFANASDLVKVMEAFKPQDPNLGTHCNAAIKIVKFVSNQGPGELSPLVQNQTLNGFIGMLDTLIRTGPGAENLRSMIDIVQTYHRLRSVHLGVGGRAPVPGLNRSSALQEAALIYGNIERYSLYWNPSDYTSPTPGAPCYKARKWYVDWAVIRNTTGRRALNISKELSALARQEVSHEPIAGIDLNPAEDFGDLVSGMDVWKIGRMGGKERAKRGKVHSTPMLMSTSTLFKRLGHTPQPGAPSTIYTMLVFGLLPTPLFSRAGDSGSFVLDSQRRLVGLHWGGTGIFSAVIPIRLIIQAIEATLGKKMELPRAGQAHSGPLPPAPPGANIVPLPPAPPGANIVPLPPTTPGNVVAGLPPQPMPRPRNSRR